MLTGFQLKAAIGVLKIRVTELSKLVSLNRFTIGKLEKTALLHKSDFHYISPYPRIWD